MSKKTAIKPPPGFVDSVSEEDSSDNGEAINLEDAENDLRVLKKPTGKTHDHLKVNRK